MEPKNRGPIPNIDSAGGIVLMLVALNLLFITPALIYAAYGALL